MGKERSSNMFPRRSISQITPGNTPREDFQEADNEMFTSLQPSRQKVPHHQPPPPTNQQQIRTSSGISSPAPKSSYTSIPPRLPRFPRNQIEAMPPAFFVTSSTESYPSAPANGSRCIEETSSVLYREAEESAGGCKSGEWDLE